MKIALISDVHANLPALRAALEVIRQERVAQIWDLGDSVGYCPFPNEVLEVFRQENIRGIRGNYDQKVLDFPRKKDEWKIVKAPNKYFSFQWTSRHLSPVNRRYLAGLPTEIRLTRQGLKLLLTHASPLGEEILDENTSQARLKEMAQAAKADVVLCGHSHFFLDKMTPEGVRFINPGSIGRPFGGDPRLSFAVLDIANGHVAATNYRLRYPIHENLQEMKRQGFPALIADSIRLGRSLDELNGE